MLIGVLIKQREVNVGISCYPELLFHVLSIHIPKLINVDHHKFQKLYQMLYAHTELT